MPPRTAIHRPAVWLVTVLALGSGLGAAPARQSATGAGSSLILGQVVDGVSGRPIPGALVSLNGDSSPDRLLADGQGRFVFLDLPAGSYTVSAEAPGYQGGVTGQMRPGGLPTLIELADRQRLGAVRVPLWRHAAVSGRVVDDIGDPVAGANVRAFQRLTSGGIVRFVPKQSAHTDDRGAYRLSGLERGEYVVSVPRPDASSLQARATDAPFLRRRVQPTTFFPTASSPADAAVLTLASGEELSSIDLQLLSVPAFVVSGTLVGPDGLPAEAPMGVRLLPANLDDFITDAGLEIASGVSAPGGGFTIPGVPPGSYSLRVLGRLPPHALPLSAEMVVSIGDADLTDVSVPLRFGTRVSGRLVFDGASGGDPRRSRITLVAADGRGVGLASAAVNAEGRFTTPPLLPGRYFVRAAAPGWTFRSAIWNGRDVAEVALELDPSVDMDGMVVHFFDRPSSLSGVVRNARGEREGSAQILLVPANYRAWLNQGSSAHRFRTATAAANGHYSMNSILPGEYLLLALDRTAAFEEPDRRRVLDAAAPAAIRITIGESASQRLDLATLEVQLP